MQALRGAEDHAGPLLPALVLAAAEAADGRDAVAAAGSFPGPGAALAGTMTPLAAIDVADQVAGLSLALFTRLRDAAAARRRLGLRGRRSARGPYARVARAAGLTMAADDRPDQSSRRCSVTSGGRPPGWRPRRHTRTRQPGPSRSGTSLSRPAGSPR